MTPIKVAILTEIISPYRIPVFNCLARDPNLSLKVIFFSETESRRLWRIAKENIEFNYQVLKGFTVSRLYQDSPLFLNPGILAELLKGNFDCIIVGGYHHPTIWLALAYAHLTNKKCLLWSESTLRDKRAKSKLKEDFKRFLVNQVSGYIAPGKAQVRYLKTLGALPDSIWVAPNSVDASLFSQAATTSKTQKDKIKQELGIEGDILLYVGRLIDDKGIPDLLKAFEKVSQKIPSVNLVLVGNGPDQEKYMCECKTCELTRVLFTGFQEQEVLPRYYAIADIFVFPTYSDPWGLVLNEAMFAELPIICSTAAGAADDLVKTGENGFLYEPGDLDSLTYLISHLLQNPEKRKEMGQQSKHIIQDYTPEKMAEGFIKAVSNV